MAGIGYYTLQTSCYREAEWCNNYRQSACGGATGGAIQSDIHAPGPIYLQGDHTAISYRNIVLTPITNE